MVYSKKIYYLDNYKYQLKGEYIGVTNIFPPKDIITDFISLDTRGLLKCSKGYAWDGATGWFDSDRILRGSLTHDALIQLVQLKLLDKKWKRQIDMELYNCCREDEMMLLEAVAVLTAVQFHDWTKTELRKVLVAP